MSFQAFSRSGTTEPCQRHGWFLWVWRHLIYQSKVCGLDREEPGRRDGGLMIWDEVGISLYQGLHHTSQAPSPFSHRHVLCKVIHLMWYMWYIRHQNHKKFTDMSTGSLIKVFSHQQSNPGSYIASVTHLEMARPLLEMAIGIEGYHKKSLYSY